MKTSAIVSLIGTVAVACISGAYLVQASRMQSEQTRITVSSSSALALLKEQADSSAAYFVAIEELDRTANSGKGVTANQIRRIDNIVNEEGAKLRPHLSYELSELIYDLGYCFDKISDNADDEAALTKSLAEMNEKKIAFTLAFYKNRLHLKCIAFPGEMLDRCKNLSSEAL